MPHPEEAALLRYVADRSDDAELLAVDTHAAGCPKCAGCIRALLALRADFDHLWPAWTAEAHGQAVHRWQLTAALARTAAASPSLAARALRWAREIGEGVEIGLRILLDRARRVAVAGTEAVPPGYAIERCPAVAGVGSGEELLRLEEHLARSSEHLVADRPAEALEELAAAVRIDARAPQAAVTEVRRGGELVLLVVADGRRGRVSIRCWPRPGAEPQALAALLRRDAGESPLVAAFGPVPGEAYLLVEFEGLADGTWTVMAGPWGEAE